MVPNTPVILHMIRLMALGNTVISTAEFIKENGSRVKYMGRERKHGLMGNIT